MKLILNLIRHSSILTPSNSANALHLQQLLCVQYF